MMKYIFSLLINWPLYLALKFMADIRRDPLSRMWYEDAANFPKLNFFQLLAQRPYYRAVVCYRLKSLGNFLKNFYPEYSHFAIGSYKKTTILGGIYLDHPFCSRIGARRIGKNFHVKQLVTMGKNTDLTKPIIGDNVFIDAGAVVVGNITVGDNVKIGANAVVMKDVPSNCTVIGNPAIIVRKDGQRVNIPL